jgi:endonuclease YncB( thermonuclease family)
MTLREPGRIIAPDDVGLESAGETLDARVLRVLDGDGFLAAIPGPLSHDWRGRIAFRFAFIDAPEMAQPFGEEAKGFLSALIVGERLRLAPVGKQSTDYMPFDRYRRLLCMAFLIETMQAGPVDYLLDGKRGTGTARTTRSVTRNIELEMIVNGWAWVLEQYAFDRQDEYFAAQEDARRNGRGLWMMNNPEPPWKFKQDQRRRRAERQPCLL